ncbi:MAG: response regulator transcription factor [Sulfurimonadaceae bacterium]|nr:response regulator transcription factor [Sulfurimonadaceae bacterium]
MKKARILLLEDDINLSETVEEYLTDEGYEVVCAYDGESAEDLLYEQTFDLLLLDVNVPEPNGFTLLKEARERGVQTPAVYVTSRNAMEDVESGFGSGADDYMRKPYELKELLLRIQTILKRNFFHHTSPRLQIDDQIEYDVDNGQLYIEGKEIALQDKEARLLKLFVQRKGEVLAHEVITDHLWSFDETPSDTALRTYIKNLRKLLGKDRIVSHKRIGYQFS